MSVSTCFSSGVPAGWSLLRTILLFRFCCPLVEISGDCVRHFRFTCIEGMFLILSLGLHQFCSAFKFYVVELIFDCRLTLSSWA